MSCSVKIDKNAYIVPNNPRLDLSANNFNGFASLSLSTFDIGVNITGNIRLMPNNTERIRITNGGNVGINNTTPNYLLDINGNANFTGSITTNNFVGNVISAGYSWRVIQLYYNGSPMGWYSPSCIAYGNGIFVSCFIGAPVAYSADGINWTYGGFYTGGYSSGYNMCFGNGIFVILVYYWASGTSYPYICVTSDAINSKTIWLSTLTTNLTNICYGNNTFVIVCNGGTNRVLTSKDGLNWTTSISNVTSGSTFDSSWSSVCYGNGQFVAVANGGNSANTTQRSMTSPDGYTWTIKATPADNTWNSICYANGLFVAVGSSGTQRVMTTNGTNSWSLVSTGETSETWKSICYGNGQFVAVADAGNYRIMTSLNATNWTLLNYSSYSLGTICYGNGIYVSGLFNTGGDTYFLVSGKQTQNLAISNTSNMSYTGLYVDKSITLYDNTSIARTSSGLQYKSPTVSHIWSLVKNTSNSSLSFSSLYGYQFNTNGTSSTNGTFALGISSTGKIQIGSTMSFSNGIPNLYVNGNVCVNGTVNIKGTTAGSMMLNIGSDLIDPTNYGLIQFTNSYGSTARSFFSFVRYITGDYWQFGPMYGNRFGMAFYGSGGRFQNSASIPCFSMLYNSAGINQTTTNSSFSYNLDVSGTGRFAQNLQTGNLTCSKITVSNVKTWYMTNLTGVTLTSYQGGYIGWDTGYGIGFGNVFLNGSTTETFGTLPYWDVNYATFTAPTTGLYMFNLHVFDTTANATTRGNCLQICGTGLPQTQPNGGQYLTFGQAYNSSEGAYVITQTLLLTAGKTIYFKNSGNDVLQFYYGKGCTELTITQLF